MLTQRIKIHGNSADEPALQIASAAILGGSVIAVPTETFYALAADPFNLQAVDQIFVIKGRQDWKPLLLLVDSVDQVERITEDIPHRFYEIAERFWPGPLTLILPAAKTLPRKVTGGTGTVGVRIPDLRSPECWRRPSIFPSLEPAQICPAIPRVQRQTRCFSNWAGKLSSCWTRATPMARHLQPFSILPASRPGW